VRYLSRSTFVRFGRNGLFCLILAAAAVTVGTRGTQDAIANGDTRTLSFHHTHTDESITITYKRDGRYDEDALKKLNWFMRDWRRQESIKMDPHLFDVVWEVYRDVDARAPIEVVCGYRSPSTNSMLRSRSRGVAQFSQHTVGKAIDLFIPGVNLTSVRDAGLRLQRGGVGFYPTSGSPFVHLDTASVRHWPRLSREQLARVFPDGKTVHLAADGRPLSGYDVAARMIEQRAGATRSRALFASHTEAEDEEMTNDGRVIYRGGNKTAVASAAAAPRKSLFAWLGGDSEEKADLAETAKPAPAKPMQVARADIAQPQPVAEAAQPAPGVPLPPSRPSAPSQLASAVVPVRPFESTISVASASAPGTFAEAPRALPQSNTAQSSPSQAGGQSGPAMRWVAGPSGAAPAPDTTASLRGTPAPGTPLPPARPAREAGGGMELASASSRPAGTEVTASVRRGLPDMITTGGEAAPATPALAYAPSSNDSFGSDTRTESRSRTAATASATPPATRTAMAAPAAGNRRDAARDPAPRLSAPRADGPGMPRLITTARFGNAAVDMRHPDAKTASGLLRGSRNPLDVRFSHGPIELAADHFAGPAIQALPLARFDVAALSTPDSEKRGTH
jgi:uncharacterized protein YcbK (DUF882 family)